MLTTTANGAVILSTNEEWKLILEPKHTMTNTWIDNTGYRNTGNQNTGARNTGYRNTGNQNTGARNTGARNTGYRNTGDRNTGARNTGDQNTGNQNTGYRNTGARNTGARNTGDRNTGNRNSANRCAWSFNTTSPKMRLFNKELDMTAEEFYRDYSIYAEIKLTEWITESDMTDLEKESNPTYKTTGWYLKERTFEEACNLRWSEADKEEKQKFLDLPWFDSSIFKEITGIDTEGKTEEMTLEDLCKELWRNIKIIK